MCPRHTATSPCPKFRSMPMANFKTVGVLRDEVNQPSKTARTRNTQDPSMVREVDYATKPIDPDVLSKPQEYPETGKHHNHKIQA